MQYSVPDILQWEKDCITELRTLEEMHECDIFHRIALLAKIIGHTHVGLGLAYPSSANSPYFSFFCTYREDWTAKYVEPQKFFNSTDATGKRTAIYHGAPSTWENEDFYSEAAANNIDLAHIYTSLCKGNSRAIIGLTASNMQGWTPDHATVLATTAIEAISAVLIKKHLRWALIELTSEDILYLRLVLDGMTSEKIADNLSQSLSYVEAIRVRLLAQFNRRRISSTAFFAFRLGLIPVSELNTTGAKDITEYRNLSLLRRHSDLRN